MKCPVCSAQAPAPAENPHRPFCSLRCKQVDLGRWVTGAYAIPGPPAEELLVDGFGELDPDDVANALDGSGPSPWALREKDDDR
ncbi:MAG: DNA gyrase inhibitor YacG [Deltaproteobacteria bacterium]|nr:DNA gyrase inhibitor YacG [Deltaproteobacteria bacterium]